MPKNQGRPARSDPVSGAHSSNDLSSVVRSMLDYEPVRSEIHESDVCAPHRPRPTAALHRSTRSLQTAHDRQSTNGKDDDPNRFEARNTRLRERPRARHLPSRERLKRTSGPLHPWPAQLADELHRMRHNRERHRPLQHQPAQPPHSSLVELVVLRLRVEHNQLGRILERQRAHLERGRFGENA